jgi:hypothetical protein
VTLEEKVEIWLLMGGEAELREPDGTPYSKGLTSKCRWFVNNDEVHHHMLSRIGARHKNLFGSDEMPDGRWVFHKR